jgi:hypothetical protein
MAQQEEITISPPPGVVKVDSLREIEGRWSDTINARFLKRLPQKIGGWVKGYTTPTNGVPRSLHAWRDHSFNPFMAVGTYIKLYVYDQGGAQNDITPIRASGTLGANPLSVTSGSNVVTVNHPAHGLAVGDLVSLAGAVAVGGIIPNVSEVPVATVIDSNNYTYVFTANATSTATGGGSSVTYQYEIPIGVELGTYGYGWGVGGWGLGTWGTARALSTIYIEPRVWSLDHFGVILIAGYNGGSVYSFDPTQIQPWPRAQLVDASAPTNVRALFVTNERFVFALLDGMQVAWPSQGTLNIWTPAIGNTANVRTLTEGTKLVAGRVLADFTCLVWSDAAVYLFQYTGSTFIYSSSMIAKDCGLISPNGGITAGGVGYWIGQNNLWTYNGSVSPMPNVEDVRKWIFDQIDINMGYQCNAQYIATFNEIWFFFTAVGSTSPNFGVIYSINEQCWAPLYWGRAGGSHFTQGDTRPYMGDAATKLIYQHENTFDADGVALAYSFSLAPYAVTKGGGQNYLVEYLVNDFKDQIGNVTQTLTAYDRIDNPTPTDTSTVTITATDSEPTEPRISGRYIALATGGNSLGCYARLGEPVVFIRRMGRRVG